MTPFEPINLISINGFVEATHSSIVCDGAANPLIDIKLIGSDGVIHEFDLQKNMNTFNYKNETIINSSFCYLRVSAKNNDMAWVSPFYFYA